MLSAITAAVALLYASAIPVHIAFSLSIGTACSFSSGIALFEPRFALKRAMNPKPKPKRTKISHSSDARRALTAALKHLRPDRLRLDGVFGSDDAALTALVCGGAGALGCAAGQRVHISLRPDFSSDRLQLQLTGMISFRAGHIMIAALSGAIEYGSRRLKQWTSIPSKAS